MEKGSPGSKQTKRYSWIIGLLIFITALLLGCIIVKNIEKEKKTAASYTAQSTVKRINAQLDQYVELSEFQEKTLFGGVIIVIDWDKFIDEIGLERLNEASYCYEIWTNDENTDDRIVLAQNQEHVPENSLTVECKIPNYTWYVDIDDLSES